MDLPRNVTAKRLRSGETAYYWRPPKADMAAGFTLSAEPLGPEAAIAFSRADTLNAHLDDWRSSRAPAKDIDKQPGFGTLEWLIERYKQSKAWDKVSDRVKPDYIYYFKVLLSVPRKSGGDIGSAPLSSIDARAADRIYEKLQTGPRGERKRLPVAIIGKAARAWDVVRRLYPKVVPALNPFRGVEMTHSKGSRAAATREEAYALHRALVEAGEPHLAVAPLVCFEWLQRPENVVGGFLAWTDYKPTDRPNAVRIMHHKTGAMVWMPLGDEDGPFFKELAEYLDCLEQIGVPIVLSRPIINPHTKVRGAPRPFTLRHAQARIRKVVRNAKLPSHLTLDACRHGGMTELGDSDLTETQEMSLSGHSTPDAKRRYIKRTEAQRLAAARKRRAWVSEQTQPQIQNGEVEGIQNGAAESG